MTEEGLFLALRPPVAPTASQFLDRIGKPEDLAVLTNPFQDQRSGGVYTRCRLGSTLRTPRLQYGGFGYVLGSPELSQDPELFPGGRDRQVRVAFGDDERCPVYKKATHDLHRTPGRLI